MTNSAPGNQPTGDQRVEIADDKCSRCRTQVAAEPHPCPYAEELSNDSETLCDCCSDCEYQCAMDI